MTCLTHWDSDSSIFVLFSALVSAYLIWNLGNVMESKEYVREGKQAQLGQLSGVWSISMSMAVAMRDLTWKPRLVPRGTVQRDPPSPPPFPLHSQQTFHFCFSE